MAITPANKVVHGADLQTVGAQIKSALAGKQDTISDLATIRSGASAGATAYQKPSTGIPASDLAAGVIPTVTPEVFWATYGTTTNTEIRAAVNAGKNVLLKYVDGYYTYIYELQQDDGDLYFYCHDGGGNRKIVLEDDGGTGTWNTPVVTVFANSSSLSGKENTSNKVTSLSSSSTDTQYPSARCVYDLLGDIETLINAL